MSGDLNRADRLKLLALPPRDRPAMAALMLGYHVSDDGKPSEDPADEPDTFRGLVVCDQIGL